MTLGRLATMAVAGLFLLPCVVQGQDTPPGRERASLSSDRPGLGDGAHVMGSGVWQTELGGTIEANTNDEFLLGSALVRFGLSNLELRLFVPGVFIREGDDHFLQLGDLALGAKFPVALGGGFDWAVTSAITLPTGSDDVSARDPGLSGALVAERALSDQVSLAFNAGYSFLVEDALDGTLSFLVTPSFAVPGQEGLNAYLGYAAFMRPGDDAHIFEWGLAKSMSPDKQWDLNAGYDPDPGAWFLGAGMSIRHR